MIDPAKAKVKATFAHPGTLYAVAADDQGRGYAGGDDSVAVIGDAIRQNGWTWAEVRALDRNGGFAFGNNPDDWKLVRFEKHIAVEPKDIPCASWRIAAASRERQAAALAN